MAPFVVTADILSEGWYRSLTQQALTQLSSVMDTGTLNTALQVQQKFNAAYGFWGSPEYDTLGVILSWIGVGFLIAAVLTMKIVTVSETTVKQEDAIPIIGPVKITNDQAPVAPPLKYCRYCGAKIPRQSKFCEECGATLSLETK